MLDFEEINALPNMMEVRALDNASLYAWGQREFCSVGEFVLAERLRDALDIIEILASECRELSTNDNAYMSRTNDYWVLLNSVDKFVREGYLNPDRMQAKSAWRKAPLK